MMYHLNHKINKNLFISY